MNCRELSDLFVGALLTMLSPAFTLGGVVAIERDRPLSGLVGRADLTSQQASFVKAVLETGDFSEAARRAGYSQAGYGSTLAKLPHVAAAIHFELERRLVAEAAPLAYKVAIELVKNPKTGDRVRADLSLKLLQMAGHGAKEGKNDNPDKPLSEMSSSELHEYLSRNQAEIDRLERELASRAKDVSAPTPATIDAKPLAYLD